MASLLQRACVGLGGTSGPSVGSPVESQTLSMGMGLVATLLSAPQVNLPQGANGSSSCTHSAGD